MNENAKILLEMYKVQVERSAHYETLRYSAVNLVLVASAILISVAALDQELSREDAWIGAALTVLGVFGFGASVAHGRRAMRHGLRAAKYRDALDVVLPDANINRVRLAVPRTSTRLNFLWNLFPVLVAAAGLVITLIAGTQ